MTRSIVTFHPRFRRHAVAEIGRDASPLDHNTAVVEDAVVEGVFVEHVMPVESMVRMAGNDADVALLACAVVEGVAWPRHVGVAVECRRASGSVAGRHSDAAYTTRDVEIAVGVTLAD